MIVEIVLFKSGHHGHPELELESAKKTVPKWRANPDLVRKHYMRDGRGNIGAVYVWKTLAAAKAAHNEAWCAEVEKRDGSRPTLQYFEMFMELDNAAGAVREFASGALAL